MEQPRLESFTEKEKAALLENKDLLLKVEMMEKYHFTPEMTDRLTSKFLKGRELILDLYRLRKDVESTMKT